MNLKFFIDRPILSVVLSVVIVLLGLIGLKSLPVEQYISNRVQIPTWQP